MRAKRRRLGCGVLLALCSAGCVTSLPRGPESISYGVPNRGFVHRPGKLAEAGLGYVRARPGEETRYATPTLLAALERAAASVARRFPGAPALRVGDLSAPRGGEHARHGSHRTGRDADVMFYATDTRGMPAPGFGMFAYDRFGVGREVRLEDGGEVAPGVYLLDLARNWHFVRTLVLDVEARVQWIFCSSGVKAQLLRHAVQHERDPEALVRAAYVLHQPSTGRSHNDHFHIRVACTPREQLAGCRDYGPIWPWQRDELDKPPARAREPQDDAALLAFLLEPPL
jgi:penicillin-insensitive murein DD-endopeptidase